MSDRLDVEPSDRTRLLIIDDEPQVVRALARELRRRHDVTTSTSAAEALEQLLRGEFDAVLCDIHMPDMDGMELWELVSRDRPGLERRLIFMTAGTLTAAAARFIRETENLVLEKPVGADAIERSIGEVRRRSSS